MSGEGEVADRPRHELLAAGAVTVAGLLLRLLGLGARPFLNDEYSTYGFASAPLAKLLGPEIAVETNPPVYYLLQKAWLVFGSSRLAMRSLPALLGALAIPVIYLIGRRLGGRAVAIVAALLFATAPVHIEFARQIRCYSALTLAACTAMACLLYLMPEPAVAVERVARTEASQRHERVLWLGYVLALAATLVLHNTGLLVVAVVGLAVGTDWLCFRSYSTPFAKRLAVATALATLPFLLWLPTLERQALGDLGAPLNWIAPMSAGVLYRQLLGAYALSKYAKPLVYGFALWTACFLLRTRPRVGAALLVVLAGQPALLALASLAKPMFLVRSLQWSTAFFPVLLALGLCRLTSIRLRSLAVAALIAIQLYSARDSYVLTYEPSPSDLAVQYVESLAGPADVVFTIPSAWEWNYSVRNSSVRALQHFTAAYGDGKAQLRAWIPAVLVQRAQLPEIARRSPSSSVWLIAERTPLYPIPREQGIEPTLDRMRTEGFTVREREIGPLVVYRISGGAGS